MVGHRRGFFERAAVVQIGGDGGRVERVVGDLLGDAGGAGAPLDHRTGVGLGQGVAGKPPRRPAVGLKQRLSRFVLQPRSTDVRGEVELQVVTAGHGVLLAAFFTHTHPKPEVLLNDVLDTHADHRIRRRHSPPVDSVDHDRFGTSQVCHALLHPITLYLGSYLIARVVLLLWHDLAGSEQKARS